MFRSFLVGYNLLEFTGVRFIIIELLPLLIIGEAWFFIDNGETSSLQVIGVAVSVFLVLCFLITFFVKLIFSNFF